MFDFEKYGVVLTPVRATNETPELLVRIHPETDVLYILAFNPELRFELGFKADGEIIVQEVRAPEDGLELLNQLTLTNRPQYHYVEGTDNPAKASFSHHGGTISFDYQKDIKDIKKYVNDNIYICVEIDLALEMIKRGIPEAIRQHSSF